MKMGPVELIMQFRTKNGIRRSGATLPVIRAHTVTRVNHEGSEMIDYLLDRHVNKSGFSHETQTVQQFKKLKCSFPVDIFSKLILYLFIFCFFRVGHIRNQFAFVVHFTRWHRE